MGILPVESNNGIGADRSAAAVVLRSPGAMLHNSAVA
jgi:hypothetical protein